MDLKDMEKNCSDFQYESTLPAVWNVGGASAILINFVYI